MARITVEDCLKNVDNRFELVLLASKRARQLARNSESKVVTDGTDKPTVLALREIAAGFVNVQDEQAIAPLYTENTENTEESTQSTSSQD